MRPGRVPRNHAGAAVTLVSVGTASMRPGRVPRNHVLPGVEAFAEFYSFNEAGARAPESRNAEPVLGHPLRELQ